MPQRWEPLASVAKGFDRGAGQGHVQAAFCWHILRLVVDGVTAPHIWVHTIVVPPARKQATQQVQIESGWHASHSGQQLVFTQVRQAESPKAGSQGEAPPAPPEPLAAMVPPLPAAALEVFVMPPAPPIPPELLPVLELLAVIPPELLPVLELLAVIPPELLLAAAVLLAFVPEGAPPSELPCPLEPWAHAIARMPEVTLAPKARMHERFTGHPPGFLGMGLRRLSRIPPGQRYHGRMMHGWRMRRVEDGCSSGVAPTPPVRPAEQPRAQPATPVRGDATTRLLRARGDDKQRAVVYTPGTMRFEAPSKRRQRGRGVRRR